MQHRNVKVEPTSDNGSADACRKTMTRHLTVDFIRIIVDAIE